MNTKASGVTNSQKKVLCCVPANTTLLYTKLSQAFDEYNLFFNGRITSVYCCRFQFTFLIFVCDTAYRSQAI
jgi:hypothetical protein